MVGEGGSDGLLLLLLCGGVGGGLLLSVGGLLDSSNWTNLELVIGRCNVGMATIDRYHYGNLLLLAILALWASRAFFIVSLEARVAGVSIAQVQS